MHCDDFGSATWWCFAPFADLITGSAVERPAAAVAQTLMALICLAFVGFGVKSFIDARRRRDTSDSD